MRTTSAADDAHASSASRVYPDGSIDILYFHRTIDAEPRVVGAMTTFADVPLRGRATILATRFRPEGAAPFFRIDADELTDRRVRLGDVAPGLLPGAELDDLEPVAALRHLASAMVRRLDRADTPDATMRFVRQQLWHGGRAIDRVAQDVGWSRQHLRRRFVSSVGLPPKLFARIGRLQRALAMKNGDRTLADLALESGYFDQAHMARDFRDLVGLPPSHPDLAGLHVPFVQGEIERAG